MPQWCTCREQEDRLICTCGVGFAGDECGVEHDGCSSNPCLNSGTCTSTFGSFACSCPSTGEVCQIQVDVGKCVSDPCTNGGTCNDTFTNFTCVCPPEFTNNNYVSRAEAAVCSGGLNRLDAVLSCPCPCGPTTWFVQRVRMLSRMHSWSKK